VGRSPHSVAVEDKGGERPAAPVAKPAPSEPVCQVAAPPPPPPARPWSLGVHAGAEQSFERYSDGIVGARGSVVLLRALPLFQFARLQADLHLASQPYRTTLPTPGQPTPTSGFAEQRFGATAEYGLDLAALAFHSSRFQLVPLAAVSWQHWQSSAFPADYLGLGGEVRALVGLTRGLSLSGGVGYSWNVLRKSGAISAVGAPRSDTFFDAGISLTVAGNHSIDLTWRGDLLAFANDYRISNGLTVGFGSTF
jgi:hypothetical protein